MENCIENIMEMLEITTDSREINEINEQLGRYQAELVEARAEGDQEQTRYLEGRISSLQEELGERRDGKDGSTEASGSIGEISFGSRGNLTHATKMKDYYTRQVNRYQEVVEHDIRSGHSTQKSMSDLRTATKRLENASREEARLKKLEK